MTRSPLDGSVLRGPGARLRRAEAGRTILAPVLAVAGLACTAPSQGDRPVAADAPTFAEEVAPIVLRSCAGCHQEGQVGPFPLTTYDEVRKRGQQIVRVIESRYMPPWLPEPGYVELVGERRLAEEEVATVRRWVEAGMPEGDPARTPPVPRRTPGWQLGTPDHVVRFDQDYTVPAGGEDLVRNFVVPLGLERQRYVRAVELSPGTPGLVHHANVLADTTGKARHLDALDPEPGYPGMEGGVAPDGHFFGWTPGRQARELEAGMAWVAQPGTDLVLQMHLQPIGREVRLEPSVGLYFTDQAPERFPATVHLVTTTIDLPAGEPARTYADEWVLPVEVDAYAIYPHAHHLGKQLKAWATMPDGSERWLLRIDDWDFNWQDEYHYRQPIHLPAGTELHLEYTYDNSAANVRNPSSPPRRVLWGPSSTDEMGNFWLKVLPRDPNEREALSRAVYRKDLEEALAGYRTRLELEPDDPGNRSQVGQILVSQERYREALPYLDGALERRPDAWHDHHNRGLALVGIGRLEEAAAAYGEALRLNPGSAESEKGLGGVLTLLGRPASAVKHYRRALELNPGLAEAHVNLAVLLARQRQVEEALFHYREALRLEPDSALAHGNLGVLYTQLGLFAEAELHFTEALRLRPDAVEGHKNLANLKARQGQVAEALEHLARVIELRPDDAQARHLFGLGLAQEGRLEAARESFQEALRLDPQLTQAHYDLALVLAQLGELAAARESLREVLELEPAHEQARQLLAQLP